MSPSSPAGTSRIPVLIVGAGPVGLSAAIRLREQGVEARVIDEQAPGEKRTYPALVHARTLRILHALGVGAPLTWRGHAVNRLAIYTERQRRCVLELPAAGPGLPGAMTLPADVLRQALMYRLSQLGARVEWNTRLIALEPYTAHVRAGVVRRERIEGAPPERKPAWSDVSAESVDAQFVIGADGRSSAVRQALGVEWVPRGEPEAYAFFDAPDRRAGDEAHLVLSAGAGSSVYPLQSDASRFTFRLPGPVSHAPELAALQHLLESRLPWYSAQAQAFEWSGGAEFQPGLAERFGEGRVWLAGDAAHTTGPLGGQSVNVGIHEADDLTRRIVEQLGSSDAQPLGTGYSAHRRLEWQRLFGLVSSRPPPRRASDWVRQNIAALLPSLPASGDDLDDLLQQLRLTSV